MKARIKTGKVFTGKLAKILVEKGVAKETRERKPVEEKEEKPKRRKKND